MNALASSIAAPEGRTDDLNNEGHEGEHDESNVVQSEGRFGIREHVHHDAVHREYFGGTVCHALLRLQD